MSKADVQDRYEVAVLAVRTGDGWQFAPKGNPSTPAGDELFTVRSRGAPDRFEEVVARSRARRRRSIHVIAAPDELRAVKAAVAA